MASLVDGRPVALLAASLFVLAAWPLLLVKLPPFQDLPNHVATAHIIEHPALFPNLAFNGFFKSNALLTLWLHLFGRDDPFGAARVFVALVLAVNALALPIFALRFVGRRALVVAVLFGWPLVHSFAVSMGFLNFSFAFGLSLILLTVVDRQRERPTVIRAMGIAALAGAVWYAHPFPLMLMGGLIGLHVLREPSWRARWRAGLTLLAPLLPAVLLALLSAQRHLMKVGHAPGKSGVSFVYLNPWELLSHLWTDVSGAFTWWGSVTLVPAVLLPVFAWRRRKLNRPFFSWPALLFLAAAYVGLPIMVSNWWYLNCRFVPFLWLGLLVCVPSTLPRAVAGALAISALVFSFVTGFDYVRLDRDRAEFTAGLQAVPARAKLLPLMFQQTKTSDFTASLTHAWGYYTVAKDVDSPLVFAVERSYPLTYRDFPPPAVIPPALDRMAEQFGTPARTCKALRRDPRDVTCADTWRALWLGFWKEAEPRFDHVLTWAMPDEARAVLPAAYHQTFAKGALAIYARGDGPTQRSAP